MIGWLIALAIAVAVNIISYVIAPKPKGPKPEAVQEGENPTASAGKPIPVVFGTVMVKEVNVLWYGDKSTHTTEVKA